MCSLTRSAIVRFVWPICEHGCVQPSRIVNTLRKSQYPCEKYYIIYNNERYEETSIDPDDTPDCQIVNLKEQPLTKEECLTDFDKNTCPRCKYILEKIQKSPCLLQQALQKYFKCVYCNEKVSFTCKLCNSCLTQSIINKLKDSDTNKRTKVFIHFIYNEIKKTLSEMTTYRNLCNENNTNMTLSDYWNRKNEEHSSESSRKPVVSSLMGDRTVVLSEVDAPAAAAAAPNHTSGIEIKTINDDWYASYDEKNKVNKTQQKQPENTQFANSSKRNSQLSKHPSILKGNKREKFKTNYTFQDPQTQLNLTVANIRYTNSSNIEKEINKDINTNDKSITKENKNSHRTVKDKKASQFAITNSSEDDENSFKYDDNIIDHSERILVHNNKIKAKPKKPKLNLVNTEDKNLNDSKKNISNTTKHPIDNKKTMNLSKETRNTKKSNSTLNGNNPVISRKKTLESKIKSKKTKESNFVKNDVNLLNNEGFSKKTLYSKHVINKKNTPLIMNVMANNAYNADVDNTVLDKTDKLIKSISENVSYEGTIRDEFLNYSFRNNYQSLNDSKKVIRSPNSNQGPGRNENREKTDRNLMSSNDHTIENFEISSTFNNDNENFLVSGTSEKLISQEQLNLSKAKKIEIREKLLDQLYENKIYDKENVAKSHYKSKNIKYAEQDIILGNKIVKIANPENLYEDVYLKHKENKTPVYFKTKHVEYDNINALIGTSTHQTGRDGRSQYLVSRNPAASSIGKDTADSEDNKGVTLFALSDRTFIDKGWTVLPTEKVFRKVNIYKMRPAHPEYDWFERNKHKEIMYYDTGEKLATFDVSGHGRWFYKNGQLALDYYSAEDMNAQQRYVIYSNGESDERGRPQPVTVLATFDYLGNGVVFDHAGKIRLKYNQTEGVIIDRSLGPPSHWMWHSLNDPPILQQVMIDTQLLQKDPDILKLGDAVDVKSTTVQEASALEQNDEMLAIEFENYLKEKSKKLTQKFKPFQIKMKALKINQNFSLRVLDQSNVVLLFRDGTVSLKLNIGMVLNQEEIVDTEAAEVGAVSNPLEQYPARTESLLGLQLSLQHARHTEKTRMLRDLRLKPKVSVCSSLERMKAAASRGLTNTMPPEKYCGHFPTAEIPPTNAKCGCRPRKVYRDNMYYDNRFI